jgi:hypothetical protein
MSGYVTPKGLELLVMSPVSLREKLSQWIDVEIANARAGKPAAIWAKLNSLVDPEVIDACPTPDADCARRQRRPPCRMQRGRFGRPVRR